jgi:hypothetical protein
MLTREGEKTEGTVEGSGEQREGKAYRTVLLLLEFS